MKSVPTALLALTLSLTAGLPASAVKIDANQVAIAPPVNDVPQWYSITASAATNGPVLARSLTTGQPVAFLSSGYRFLAFGWDTRVVTLAVHGQVAYIPATAAAAVFPVPPPTNDWKAYGPTLEERAELERQKAKAAQSRGLEPKAYQKQEAAVLLPGQTPGIPAGQPGVPAGK